MQLKSHIHSIRKVEEKHQVVSIFMYLKNCIFHLIVNEWFLKSLYGILSCLFTMFYWSISCTEKKKSTLHKGAGWCTVTSQIHLYCQHPHQETKHYQHSGRPHCDSSQALNLNNNHYLVSKSRDSFCQFLSFFITGNIEYMLLCVSLLLLNITFVIFIYINVDYSFHCSVVFYL